MERFLRIWKSDWGNWKSEEALTLSRSQDCWDQLQFLRVHVICCQSVVKKNLEIWWVKKNLIFFWVGNMLCYRAIFLANFSYLHLCSLVVQETGFQSLDGSYQRLLKWYLIPLCLTLSIIRYVSKVKWSNPVKGVAPSPTHWCCSYWKGSLQVALDNGRQLYLLLHIYIYIYIYIGAVCKYFLIGDEK